MYKILSLDFPVTNALQNMYFLYLLGAGKLLSLQCEFLKMQLNSRLMQLHEANPNTLAAILLCTAEVILIVSV